MDVLITSLTEARKIEPFLNRDIISDIVLCAVGVFLFFFMDHIAVKYSRKSKGYWFYHIFAWLGFILFVVSGISAGNTYDYKKSAVNDNEAYARAVHIKHKYPHLSAYSKKAKTYYKLVNKSADRVKYVHLSGVQHMFGDW